MITNEYIFAMNCNRQAQRDFTSLEMLFTANPQLYSNQMTKIFQACDSSGLKKSTKYMAKKLIDKYMSLHPQIDQSEWELVMISLFRYATKFNQVAYISDSFTFDQCIRLCGESYTRSQFQEFQKQILLDTQFNNLIFCSPYDYFQTFRDVFVLMPKLAAKIQIILDFCITIPQFINRSAQQMFFGALWMIKLCKQDVFQLDQKIISAQTKNWKKAIQLGERLKIYYENEVEAAMEQQYSDI